MERDDNPVTYEKKRLTRAEYKNLRGQGLFRCPGRYCPEKLVPVSELKSIYCKICMHYHNKSQKRKRQAGIEGELSRRTRLRRTVPDGFFLCFGSLCIAKNTQGVLKPVGERLSNEDRCQDCRLVYMRSRSAIRRNFRIPEGSVCELCGCDDGRILELDHVDRKTKSQTPCTIQGMTLLEIERKKCRILCILCHRQVTRNQFDAEKKNYGLMRKDAVGFFNWCITGTKSCPGCFCNGKLVPLFCFRNLSGGRKGTGRYCYYFSGHQQQEKIKKQREYIKSKKMQIGSCQQCFLRVTEDTLFLYDFDHTDPTGATDPKMRKTEKVSSLVYTAGLNGEKKIDEEISKCQLLCCACHRIKTKEDHKLKMEQRLPISSTVAN